MIDLELLAPAKNIEIGIAAIDCGADAVYIAGPAFGARQAAGNSMEDLAKLCSYAHKFGARIFMTLNTIIYDDELQEAYSLMCRAEDAGVDAIIVQDTAILKMADGGPDGKGRRIRIPLHGAVKNQGNQSCHRQRNRVLRTWCPLRLLQRAMLSVRAHYGKECKSRRVHPGMPFAL